MTPEEKLAEMGLVLPPVATPTANYVPYRMVGNLLYLSGIGPCKADGTCALGKVGATVTVAEAYEHAKLAGLALLANAKAALGTLDRIEMVVKLLGMVNAVPEFGQQPEVINGCSDLFVAVLGERGRHARSAVGMGSLPFGMTVEIEAILAVR